MGYIIKGCDCIKREELAESKETDCNQKQPLNSIIDVKINLKNFVRQRNENYLDVYDKLEILGQGAFGDVYKVRRKNDKEIRALKEIKKKSLKVSELKNEINILKEIDHPNIVFYFIFLR
jgi:serine/threonine protein kinase